MAVGLYKRNGVGDTWLIDTDAWQTRRRVTSSDELNFWLGVGKTIQNLPAPWFDSIPIA